MLGNAGVVGAPPRGLLETLHPSPRKCAEGEHPACLQDVDPESTLEEYQKAGDEFLICFETKEADKATGLNSSVRVEVRHFNSRAGAAAPGPRLHRPFIIIIARIHVEGRRRRVVGEESLGWRQSMSSACRSQEHRVLDFNEVFETPGEEGEEEEEYEGELPRSLPLTALGNPTPGELGGDWRVPMRSVACFNLVWKAASVFTAVTDTLAQFRPPT